MQAPRPLTAAIVNLLPFPESQDMLLIPTIHNFIFNILSSKSAIKTLLSGCGLNHSLNNFSTLPLRNLNLFLIVLSFL